MNESKFFEFKLKFCVVFLSYFLMLKSWIMNEQGYYTTLAIFFLSVLVDMAFTKKNEDYIFFVTWSFFNKLLTFIGTLFLICVIVSPSNILDLIRNYDYIFIFIASSYILEDFIKITITSFKMNVLSEVGKKE